MEKEIINKILDEMSKGININKNVDIIKELFISRDDELHELILKNDEYIKLCEKSTEIYNLIEKKYKDSSEILNVFEEYSDIIDNKSYICEKLMYKFGVIDALLLFLQLISKVDIKKFLKENI